MNDMQTQQPAPTLENLLAQVERSAQFAAEYRQAGLEIAGLFVSSPDDPRRGRWLELCRVAVAGSLVNLAQAEQATHTLLAALFAFQQRAVAVVAKLQLQSAQPTAAGAAR
ncbi:MAG TPA: hypothetical protein VF897_04250 [Roseiflexaceae bacterium]